MKILNDTLLQDLCATSIDDLTALEQTITTIRDLKQRIIPANKAESFSPTREISFTIFSSSAPPGRAKHGTSSFLCSPAC